jgi:hypothetical protein
MGNPAKNQKKCGIMTLYHENYNFGGILQTFALQHAISNLGWDCSVIDFAAGQKNSIKRKLLKTPFRVLWKRVISKLLYQIKNSTDASFREKVAQRKRSFRTFMENIPHTFKCDSTTIKTMFSNAFDVVVVGSDQVWNLSWMVPEYFLNFCSPTTTKIAYAASMDASKISPADGTYIGRLTDGFRAISVRELGTKQLLEPYVKIPLCVSLDPTLLFLRDFWDTITISPKEKTPYVLLYFPGEKNETQLRQYYDFCRHEGLKLLTFPHFQGKYDKVDERYSDIRNYSAGPLEFLGLIREAKYVITGSFHATVFSILFEKQFVSLRKREERNQDQKLLRSGSLLTCLGLEERLQPFDWVPSRAFLNAPIAYDIAKQKLERLRIESLTYLKNALEKEVL